MKELSVFIDESGSDGLTDQYYLLTLVLHEQSNAIEDGINRYEQALFDKGLPNIPFHGSPLLNGHKDYQDMLLGDRKRLLSSFRVFFRHLPVRYACITLKTKNFNDVEEISNAMRRSLIELLFDELEYFQSFEMVKIYYDEGQQSIATAVHKAMDYVLARNSIEYRRTSPEDYRLGQIADYLCTIELTALKYADKKTTATDEKFFGSWSMFKKGFLKEARAKRVG